MADFQSCEQPSQISFYGFLEIATCYSCGIMKWLFTRVVDSECPASYSMKWWAMWLILSILLNPRTPIFIENSSQKAVWSVILILLNSGMKFLAFWRWSVWFYFFRTFQRTYENCSHSRSTLFLISFMIQRSSYFCHDSVVILMKSSVLGISIYNQWIT